MARRYFGTDGVRGVAGEFLTAALVERLGSAPEHGGASEPFDERGGEELAGDAANAGGAEVPARHRPAG